MGKEKLLLFSAENIDRVIFSKRIDTSVANSVGNTTFTYGDTGIEQYGRPMGIYSFDGGASYNDFAPTTIPGGSLLSNSNASTAPSVIVQPRIDSFGQLSFVIRVVRVIGGWDGKIIIKIALLAVDAPLTTNTAPQLSSESKLAYTTRSKGIDTRYREIIRSGFSPQSGSTPTIFTVNHDLRYVPNPGVWWNDGTFNTIFSNFYEVRMKPFGANNGGVSGMGMDSNNFYFSPLTALQFSQAAYRCYEVG